MANMKVDIMIMISFRLLLQRAMSMSVSSQAGQNYQPRPCEGRILPITIYAPKSPPTHCIRNVHCVN